MKALTTLCTVVLALQGVCGVAHAQALKAGAATYYVKARDSDPEPPAAPFRTEAMLRQAVPTNQWYSTLVFNAQPEAIYAQPLSVRPTPAGLELALPTKEVAATERKDVEIRYLHRDPLVISPTAFEPGQSRLAGTGDWSVRIDMSRGEDRFVATVAHGSPYVYFAIGRGDVRVALPQGADAAVAPADARALLVHSAGREYAVFGPTGVRWEASGGGGWTGRLPQGHGWVSAAALPDPSPQSFALIAKHAYAFLDDTRVSWQFDVAHSQVVTTFTASTKVVEGSESAPLLGLYPHHWFRNSTLEGKLGPSYDTVRGKLKLLEGASFSTTTAYPGFVPFWPKVSAGDRQGDLDDVMKTDVRNARRMMLEIGNGPYWQGKGLQRITTLMGVVEQQGNLQARDTLLHLAQGRIESWFSGESSKTYFHLDRGLGTLVAYPEEYFSVTQMNDHHFHYGYWIRAMAEIALRDPQWASREQWGGMVDLLIRDIASTERGGTDAPFLRNFDPYEGHSWASGVDMGPFGNNQESSSEAVNAWAALILWGESTGNRMLRDLGAYLYSTEISAIEHYWFDQHGLVFAPEYGHVEASMLFGAKYAHNTWWTDEPRQIKGINLLPLATSSAYLARDPAFIQRSLGTLKSDTETYLSRGKGYGSVPKDIWQDIFAQYEALADPAQALAAWDRWGSFELGDTRTHALHWLLSLKEMGTPDMSTTADTALYSVFARKDGKRTYLAYNAGSAAVTVHFSDGKTLEAAPHALAVTH